MKKFFYTFCCTLMLTSLSCDAYLDVASPSNVDEDFVFSTPDEAYKVLMSCYELFRSPGNDYGSNTVHSNGLFYEVIIGGSDSETHPEAYSAQQRHIPEGLYAEEITIDYSAFISGWGALYMLANRLAIVISQIETKDAFKTAWDNQQPSEWTQMYGEAVTLRAICYHELIRFYGDVPYFDGPIYTQNQTDGVTLISRWAIYDKLIASVQRVEPFMFRLGEGGIGGERISRTFAQAMIGRIALYAAGYHLCRLDIDHGVALERHPTINGTKWNAIYARHPQYRQYYETARQYLEACIAAPGSARLITTDDRAHTSNPFQRHFQYSLDLQVSPETLFEVAETQGIQCERPYAFGRPSNGGNANASPCNAYGQSRMHPSVYYGDFANDDMRRDVSITVTSSTGAAKEQIQEFGPGARKLGGLVNNKWDENRMNPPYKASRRQSGVNAPYMRMADAILMLAEAYAELGSEGPARAEWLKVRNRAFRTDQSSYVNGFSGDALKEAIAQERKLEFVGEGLRRYDLIRTGKLPEKIIALRQTQQAMVDALRTQEYYAFPNGNVIPAYIWTKAVNTADLGMSTMLTYECDVPPTDPAYPVKFPGWRGQYDGYGAGLDNTNGNRSIAIQGLFRFIAEGSAEANALIAQGYAKTPWGSTIVTNEAHYTTDLFRGYTQADLAAGNPPRYLLPLSSETIAKSKGLISNGYGFAQQ
ncbi:MAG: RagB/SusD family nutrient uptake outer membrane protein [Prevotellaceae bacterium]|jgi:hypothetical protein|nr:RagB/SusD family nutrient uptake outer membrane protein [Prevotellaceae bacterium]